MLLRTLLLVAAGTPAGPVAQSPPPASFDRSATFHAEAAVPGSPSRISIDVGFSMAERSVDYRYAYAGLEPRLTEHRSFTVDFWPSACNAGPAHTTYVVGRGLADEGFVAEVWRFETPSVVPGLRASGGGETSPRIEMGARTSVARVHEIAVSGGIPRAVVQLAGSTPEAFLVYFDRSRQLCSVDARSGSLRVVVSPTAVEGALVEPGLLADWSSFSVREHVTDGYVTVARQGTDVGSEGASILLLVDSDEDGALDSTRVVSPATWRALGYHDPRQWVEDR